MLSDEARAHIARLQQQERRTKERRREEERSELSRYSVDGGADRRAIAESW